MPHAWTSSESRLCVFLIYACTHYPGRTNITSIFYRTVLVHRSPSNMVPGIFFFSSCFLLTVGAGGMRAGPLRHDQMGIP
ncbi:hypothetical protein BDZ94DRAFT_1248195 [Collybia nuda]|uniref:Uncharacterized protein n=1 Tax=Collybia nuda TaxID=64659 RepID=A0A9P6CPG3_9AGAR|nr:hypothetical protein BDZ94DRAFT_1248195 [Collybia nuda]